MTVSAFDHPWLGALFGDAEIAGLWAAERQLAHMLAFERALSRAFAASGRIDAEAEARALSHLEAFAADIPALAQATLTDGVVAPGLVRQIRAGLDDAQAIHTGATSQDVVDTALVLTLRDLCDVLEGRLAMVLDALDAVAEQFGDRLIMGRTRMQAALPIRAGHRIAVWRDGVDAHRERLESMRPDLLRVQLGGPVGDRSGFGAHGDAMADHVADSLGLGAAPLAWHAERSAVVVFGGWLAQLTGTLGKIGQDVCLMAQQGVDEIALSGGGKSSAMAHKNNPVAAELLVTLAHYASAQAGGLNTAMLHEQERSGTAWMLEWMLLPPLSAAAGRSLAVTATMLGAVERIGNS